MLPIIIIRIIISLWKNTCVYISDYFIRVRGILGKTNVNLMDVESWSFEETGF